jgi:hypothetical protein
MGGGVCVSVLVSDKLIFDWSVSILFVSLPRGFNTVILFSGLRGVATDCFCLGDKLIEDLSFLYT